MQKARKELDKLCTAKEMTEELSVIGTCFNGTEDMLFPAPLAIMMAGKLTLISNGMDFSLTEPRGGFDLLKWRSFRACMFDVSLSQQDT